MSKKGLDLVIRKVSLRLYIVITMILIICVLLVLSITNKSKLDDCFNNEQYLLGRINDLETEYDSLRIEKDGYIKALNEAHQELRTVPRLPKLEIEGIENANDYVKSDLMKHNELIPFDGVLGGTMRFNPRKSIHVLFGNWIFAEFEDGHIGGYMLLKYNISDKNKINWKVLDSYLD